MVKLGIIEGFFGRCWSWLERRKVVSLLGPAGYEFYHYAPKIDTKLRRNWQQPYDATELKALTEFAAACRSEGVRFGVGLTPFAAHLDFSEDAKAALKAKLAQLDDVGIEELAVLFDDMDGDLPDLAQRQAAIVDFATAHSKAGRFFTCPSYYSDDPLLDRVFGRRPDHYLEDLGKLIDPAIAIYWTGEEVCSREVSVGHIDEVTQRLGRKPALWDNYPVNDGPRMSQFLHLRAFTGRSSRLSGKLSHHAINPASQPLLTCIPALTLPEAYRLGDDYQYGRAFLDAANTICLPELASMILSNLLTFNDTGLERMGEATKAKLIAKYEVIDHPAANEIVDWLKGGYAITGEMLQTQ